MNIGITVTLDKRYRKKDGSFAVIIRLADGRSERTLPIPTGVSVPEKYWDEKKKEIKSSYPGITSVSRLNNQIDAKKRHARDVILTLTDSGQIITMTLSDVKDRIVNKANADDFFGFSDKLFRDLIQAKRIGTKNSYEDSVKFVENYLGKRHLPFPQLNYEFLIKLETAHFAKGNTPNGLAVYLRSIRAIYNRAIKAGIVSEQYYPFKKYTIKTVPTEKRALEIEPIKAIISLRLEKEHALFHARNYFVASYMMYGMNYTDMAYLKRVNIVDGRIRYRRSKTSKLYDIKLTPTLNEILSFYLSLDAKDDYVFPIIKRETAIDQNRDIEWARKRYNQKLKKLAKVCNIESNLTSYVSRHSFATQAMLLEIPLNAISAMLGHSSLKTTQIYLKSLPSNILDSFNEKLLNQ